MKYMTVRECAIIEAYTGVCMTVGENREYFYKYLEELLDRPVFTHELADEHIVNEIKTLSLRDFQELCRTAEIPGEDVQKPQDDFFDVCPICGSSDLFYGSVIDWGCGPLESGIKYKKECKNCGTNVVADGLNLLKIEWYKLWKGISDDEDNKNGNED